MREGLISRWYRAPAAGRARSFQELLDEHLGALYHCALRCCAGRQADAEDLLQDAMLSACRHFAELRDPAAARAWLFTILARTNLNRLRRLQRRAELLATDLGEADFEAALASWRESAGPEVQADAALARERLLAALDGLPAEIRPVVWLSDVEGFRQREVAQMLDIPEGTVASRLFRARRSLRDALKEPKPWVNGRRRGTTGT